MSKIEYNENNQCRLVNDKFPPSEWFDYIDEKASSGYRRYKCQRIIPASIDERSKKEITPKRETTKWGYINDENPTQKLFEGEYEEIKPCRDGYFAVKTSRGWSISVPIDNRYYDVDYYEDAMFWDNGFMSLQYPQSSDFGLKWRLLKYEIPARPIEPKDPKWREIEAEYDFKDTIFTENLIFCRYKENVWRMFNKDGKRLNKNNSFSEVRQYSTTPFIIINTRDGYGILDKYGKIAIEAKYKDISFDEANLEFILTDENGKTSILQVIEKLESPDVEDLIALMKENASIYESFANFPKLNDLYNFLKKAEYDEENIIQVLALLEKENIKKSFEQKIELQKQQSVYKELEQKLNELKNQSPESAIKTHPVEKLLDVGNMQGLIFDLREKRGKTDDEIFDWFKNFYPEKCADAERHVEEELKVQNEILKKEHQDKIAEIERRMKKLSFDIPKDEVVVEENDSDTLEGLPIEINTLVSEKEALDIIGGSVLDRNVINGKKYIGIFFEKGKKLYGIEQGWNKQSNCYYFAGVGKPVSGNQFIGTNNENAVIVKNKKKIFLFESEGDKCKFVDLLKYIEHNPNIEDDGRQVIKFNFKSLIAHRVAE